MIRSAALLAVLALFLTACGGGGGGSDAEFIDDRVLLEGIRVSPAENTLGVGQTQNYTATGEYSDGSEQNLTSSVSWSSSTADVASIDSTGLATAISIGESSITASLDGIRGSAALTVIAPVVMETTILPPVADIPLGGTQDYRAFAIYSDGSFENVTFTAEWALRNESGIIEAYEPVLTRGLNALDDFGTVVGVELGEDELIASIDGVGTESAVAVVDPQLTDLSIKPKNDTQPVGAVVSFTATGTYSDGSNADLTKVVMWASTDSTIADISNEPGERGITDALTPGQVTISASFEGFTDDTLFSVIDDGGDDVVRVDVLPPNATIGVGETETYTAIAITRDGDSFDVTTGATWASSNEGVAGISASGTATGVSGGTTTISAGFDGVTGSATLIVEAEVLLESISVSPANPTFVSFTRATFVAIGNYSDGSARNVTDSATWQSEDRSIVLVSNDPEFGHGAAFTLLPGETVVSASLSGITGQTNVEVIAPDESPAQLVVSPALAQVPIGGSQQYRAEVVFQGRSALDVSDVVTWTSLNSLIAEVDASGLATGLATGSASIQAALSVGDFNFESKATLQVLAPPVVVEEIIVSPPSASVIVSDTQAFTARALLSNGTDLDVTSEVSWSTVDGNVAVIDLSGLATGVAAGTTEVKARLRFEGDIFDDVATLTVNEPALTGLEVTPSRIEVLPGSTAVFTARAYFENGTSEDVTDLVAWTSSDPAVASVDATGVATAIAPGASDITATVNYQGATFSDSGRLSVKETPVTITELLIEPATAEILVEGKQSFTARVLLSDNTDQDVTSQVSWISADPAIASINGSGRATGISPGDTTIEAALTYNGATYTDTADLTVLPPLVTIDSIVVEPPNDSVLVGGTSQFTARIILSDGTSQEVSNEVTWTSSDSSIAHVDSAGLATGIAEGKSDISATLIYEGRTYADSGRLTVNPQAITITEVRVLPVSATVFVEGKIQFTAEAVLSNDDVVDVTTDVSWLAVDGTIASIDATGRATGLAPGQSNINATLSYEGDTFTGTATLTVNPPEVTVEELIVEPVRAQVLVGSSQQFTARLVFSDATQQIVTDSATWSSSDSNVASVSLGLATGLSRGGSDIAASVTVDGEVYSDSGRLTVNEPANVVTAIRIDPDSAEILIGTTQQYLATAIYNDGSETDITRDVTWTLDNTDIAHISTTGLTTGVEAGTTTVNATFTSGTSSFSDTAALTVQALPVTVTELVITPETAEVLVDGTVAYTATAKLSDNTEQDVTDNIAWVSGQPNIAQIDGAGIAKGIAEGIATIKAQLTYGDGEVVKDSVSLTVKAPAVIVESLVISPNSADVFEGGQAQYTATAVLSDDSQLDVTRDVTWTTDNDTIASVSTLGLATGNSMGTTNVAASLASTDGSVFDTAIINVTTPVLESIVLNPIDQTIIVDATLQFTASGSYSDGTTRIIQPNWSSSETGVADISTEGLATALSGGTTSISAELDGITATTGLTVLARMIDDLWIFPSSVDDAAGTLGRLSAVAHFNDNTTEVVTQLGDWKTADSDLVTVVNTIPLKGGYALRLPGSSTISVDYMGFSDTIPVTVSDPALVQIVVTPLVETTPVGVNAAFIATGLYANLTTSDLTDDVTWASSNPGVSDITDTGIASSLKEGTATISATFEGLVGEATHEVTTAIIDELIITPPEFAGPAGTTKQFEAFAQYTDGTQQEVTNQVVWTSSNEAIVFIGNDGTNEQPGKAELIAAGSVSVSATFENLQDSAPVEVTEPVVVDLFVNPYGETYPSGLLVEFTAIATYDNGTDADVTADAVWHSTNSDVIVANPDSPGQFQTVAAGEADVTATFAEILEDSPVTVTPAQVIELQIEPGSPEGPAGTQDQLTATAFYDNLTREDVTDQAAWSSSEPSIVNVVPSGDDQGFIQFLAEGTAEISATFEGVTQSVTATATQAVLIDIIVQPPNEKVAKGLTLQYEAIGIYSDGTSTPLINSGGILSRVLTDEVVWSTSSSSIAQVDTSGLVTTVNVGNTNVSATFGGLTGTTSLEVTSATVSALEIQPISNTGPAGTDEPITAIATLTNESTLDVSDLVVWGTSSGFVATISYNPATDLALLSYNNEGTATISATLGEGDSAIVANAEAVTTAATLERIELLPNPLTLPAGTIRPLVATGFFSDGSIQFLNDDADFTSSDPTIATVTQLGVVNGVALGTTTVTASLGDISGSTQVTVTDAILIDLQITPADVIGPAGTELRLEATGLYSNGDTQPLTAQVTWRSDNDLIATVTNSGEEAGLLELIAPGVTEVSAVFDEVVDTINVEVTTAALTAIRIQPLVSLMPSGTTQQMAAFGDYTDGSFQDITTGVTWSSGNTGSVQIDSEGFVTAFDQGVSTIRATLDGVGSLAEILVTSPVLVNLQITPSTLVEPAGSSGQFTATGLYSSGLERDLTNEVIWESSNTDIVTVNNLINPGLARLIQPGSVTVTASLAGISDSVPVEVTNAVLESIRVSPSLESVAEGTEVQYSAIGEFTDGSTTPIDEDVSWSTSNTSIATINAGGLADTVGKGDVEIRAVTGNITGTAQLEVTDAVPERLDINPSSSPALLVGQTRQYEAVLTYTDGQTAVVTGQVNWIVEPSNVATTTATPGLIQGTEPGTGEVVARFTASAFGKASTTLEDRVTLEVDAPSIISVEINTFRETGQAVEIPAGRAEGWQAFANFNDGTFVEITDDAIWTSSDQRVATVLDGNVDALVSGTTTISILYINLDGTFQAPRALLQNLTDSVSLTVTNAVLTDIDINPDDAIVAPGQTASFTAIGNFSDNSSENITADSNWSVEDGSIAAIDRVTDTATVRGLEVGTTTVTVNQSGVSASASIEVTDAQIPERLVVSDALPVSVGSLWPFTATVTYTDGDTAVVTNDATWSSSDVDVATVYNVPDEDTPRGTASAESEGTTTITADFQGIVGSAVFEVSPACEASGPNGKPDSVFIIPDSPVLPNIGDTVQMQAIGVFAGDCELSLTLDPQTQWKVTGQGGSNKILEVNEQGVVTGLKCGTGEVEANHRGVKATMAVQVCE